MRTSWQAFDAGAFDPAPIRAHAETFGTARFESAFGAAVADLIADGGRMLRRYNRLLVACYVAADLLSAAAAFLLAYLVRFDSWFVQLVPVTKNQPPFSQYLVSLPVIALLVPLAFQIQGLYRLRRGRTRVDDFFAVLVGSILAVHGRRRRLAVRARRYYPAAAASSIPISRAVWLLFLALTVHVHVHLARSRARPAAAALAGRASASSTC